MHFRDKMYPAFVDKEIHVSFRTFLLNVCFKFKLMSELTFCGCTTDLQYYAGSKESCRHVSLTNETALYEILALI